MKCTDPNCCHSEDRHDATGKCLVPTIYESSGGTWYERPCSCRGFRAAARTDRDRLQEIDVELSENHVGVAHSLIVQWATEIQKELPAIKQ
jgi:hypothetical protein